jgi:hypothetical protein
VATRRAARSAAPIHRAGRKPVSRSPSGPVSPVRSASSSGCPVTFSTNRPRTIGPTLEYRKTPPAAAPATVGVARTARHRAARSAAPARFAPTGRPPVCASSMATVIPALPSPTNSGRYRATGAASSTVPRSTCWSTSSAV